MLKRYTATSVTASGDATYTVGETTFQMKTLITVPSGKECAIVGIDIQNGGAAANVAITVSRSGSVISAMHFTLAAHDFISIDSKEFLEAGDTIAFGATAAGLLCAVSCDLSDAE